MAGRDMTSGCKKTAQIMDTFRTAHSRLSFYNSDRPIDSDSNLGCLLQSRTSALGKIGIEANPELLKIRANSEQLVRDWERESYRETDGVPYEIVRVMEARRLRSNQVAFESNSRGYVFDAGMAGARYQLVGSTFVGCNSIVFGSVTNKSRIRSVAISTTFSLKRRMG